MQFTVLKIKGNDMFLLLLSAYFLSGILTFLISSRRAEYGLSVNESLALVFFWFALLVIATIFKLDDLNQKLSKGE